MSKNKSEHKKVGPRVQTVQVTKKYVVVAHEEIDEHVVMRLMTVAEIERYATERHHGDFCVVDGEVVKSFDDVFSKRGLE
jgi:hypothetical protein